MKYCILFITVFLAIQVQAQKELPSEKVDVISNFEATIKDQNKVDVKPVLVDDKEEKTTLKYSLSQRLLGDITYDAPKIKPLAMKTEKGPKAYNGFAKLGYGIPSSPYIHAGYTYANEDKFKIGATVFHHSANNKSVPNQKFGLTTVDLYGGINTEIGLALDGGLKIEDHRYNYYSVDSLPDGVEPLRKFNITGFRAKAFNTKETSWGINYDVGLDYTNLKSNTNIKENDFDIHIGATKWFNDNVPFKILLGTHLTSLQDSVKSSLNNFYLRPSLGYSGDAFNIRAGLNLISTNDKFSLLPDLEGSVRISGNALSIYAGWFGDVQKNTYRSIMLENPFVATHETLTNTTYNRFYGGIRGKVGAIGYQGEAGFKSVTNMPLYINDSLETYGFNVIYDDVDIFNVNGTLIIDLAKGFTFTGNVGYNIYTTDVQPEAWHLPSIEANLGLTLLALNDKMRIKAELYIADPGKFKHWETNSAGETNGLFDISFEVAYRFSEKFGAFFQLNNLPNNKYQRWYNTPNYGLNILGGLTARF